MSEITALRRKQADVQILGFSDGGRRANGGGAAAAWVIVDADRHVIAMAGTYLGPGFDISSFETELVGLHSLLEFIRAEL